MIEKAQSEYKESISIPRSNMDDIVDNVFRINLDEEILELSNEFCKYYSVTHTESKKDYFAIVFERNFLPAIKNIDFLLKHPVEGLNTIINYSIVRISSTQDERLVVIVESYDYQDNLESFLAKGGEINADLLVEMVTKMTNILAKLQAGDIYGVTINPANILIKNGRFLGLREFIDSYPNFYQKDHYLAPELVECMPAARFIESSKSDVYALGITMFQAYTKKEHWNNHKKIYDYNIVRFENTTYKYLLGRTKLSEKLRVFFKFTLSDDASTRWGLKNLQEWLDGKTVRFARESIVDNKNAISFNDNSYFTKKALAYAFFYNWGEAVKFIKDSKLFKWASRVQFSNNDLETIKSFSDKKSETPFLVTNVLSSHIKLSKFLSILDKNGPIRQENLALSAASISTFLHFLLVNNKKALAEKVMKIIAGEEWAAYEEVEDASGHLGKSKADIFTDIEVSSSGVSAKLIDKLVYSINPNSICRSVLLKKYYVSTLPDLLVKLDYIAEHEPSKFQVDQHIVSFVFARLNLKEGMGNAILPSFPKISEHSTIKALNIINILHQNEPDIDISNICRVITSNLKELLGYHLHHKDFKAKILSVIDEAAKDSDLSKIIQVLSQQQQFINDYNGYYEACKRVKALETRIKKLNDKSSIFDNALLLGQKMTVLVSYVLCFIVTVSVIMMSK